NEESNSSENQCQDQQYCDPHGAPFVQRTPITRRYRPQNAPTRIPQEPGLVPHDRREFVPLSRRRGRPYQDHSPTTGGSVSPCCRDAKGSIRIIPPRPEGVCLPGAGMRRALSGSVPHDRRSEEHTSELQSRENLVCRL